MANLANLSNQDLLSEANLAADLVRNAATSGNPQAEIEAERLFHRLLTELSRREEAAEAAARLTSVNAYS